jgi:hypothetical protein
MDADAAGLAAGVQGSFESGIAGKCPAPRNKSDAVGFISGLRCMGPRGADARFFREKVAHYLDFSK